MTHAAFDDGVLAWVRLGRTEDGVVVHGICIDDPSGLGEYQLFHHVRGDRDPEVFREERALVVTHLVC